MLLAANVAICLHCRRTKRLHRRHLCYRCYLIPEIRGRYPASTLPQGRRGYQCHNVTPPLPPCPTNALPGSKEKVEVMQWRIKNGYAACHPGDLVERG